MSSGDVFDASQEDLDGGAGKVGQVREIMLSPDYAVKESGQDGRAVEEEVSAIAKTLSNAVSDHGALCARTEECIKMQC